MQVEVNLDLQATILLIAALGLTGDLETTSKSLGLVNGTLHGILAVLAAALREVIGNGGGRAGW